MGVRVCNPILNHGRETTEERGSGWQTSPFPDPNALLLVGGTESALAGLATPVASLISPEVDKSTPGSNGEQDWSLRVRAKSLRA